MKFTLFALTGFLIAACGSHSEQKIEHTDSSNHNLINTKAMNNNNSYTSTILVDKTPAQAFVAIENFKGWWSEDIEGETNKLGETFFYHYKDIHLCKIKLIEVVPNKKLVYEVMDNEFNFTKDKTEWIHTKLVFDLSAEGNQTKVTFTHEGLVPSYECYNVCHDAWTGFIQKSLKSYINTGKGEPNPKDGTNEINAENLKKWKLK